MTWPKSLAAVLVAAAVSLFILSQAPGFAADRDLLANGGFTDDLSGWETTITPGYEGNGEIVHDRRYFGLREGSLRVETGRGRGIRLQAIARQQIKGLKKGSKLRLSLWWRKQITAGRPRDAETEISVWLKGDGVAPLLLWRDKTVPPVPGTAVSSRINGLELGRSVTRSGAYDLVVQFTMKTGADPAGRALAQVDDVHLQEIEEAPIVVEQTALASQTVRAGAGGVKAMAFSLTSGGGDDVVSRMTLKESGGDAPSFARVHLFHDTEPFGRLDAGDLELAEAVNQDGGFTLKGLTLPLGKGAAIRLLVTVDTAENANDGLSRSLILEQVQGLFRRTNIQQRAGAEIRVDAKAPASTTSFLIMSEGMPFLIWENPSDPEFTRFRLVRKKNAPPSGPFDGRAKVMVDAKRPAGSIGTFIDRHPGTGKFFYAVYTADRLGNYQTATLPGINAGVVESKKGKPVL